MPANYDIIIIGGGPSGLSLACLAADLDLTVAIVDKLSEAQLEAPAIDGRDIALTHRSVQILDALSVWGSIAAEDVAPIRRACVINADQEHRLRFDPDTTGHAALGYLVSNHILRTELCRAARKRARVSFILGDEVKDLDLSGPVAALSLSSGRVIKSRLVVAADSRFSQARRQAGIGVEMRDFGRTCIVCRLKHERPHDETAYEWFDTDQTLALLPLNDRHSSIVITQPTASAVATMKLPVDAFVAAVTQRLKARWGPMELVGERHAYPLIGVYADRFAAHHFALIGDAAVGMHPVTAHGFNFGLMGAHTLAEKLRVAIGTGMNIGAADVLQGYDREHRRATYPLYLATNALVRIYTDNGMLARVARSAILRIGDHLTPLKDLMLRKLTEVDDPLASTGTFALHGARDSGWEARSRP
jgi:ubiquinone biosynthesis UbiH/UbiF/VisC/COQ6 family hydroxylase